MAGGCAGERRLVAPRRACPSRQGVECPGKHQARCARIHRETKPGRGGGAAREAGAGARGVQISSPGRRLPHRLAAPEPSPRTGGAGAGRRPGGSRPGGGAGRGGRGGAALCKCRPRAANCRRSPRGSERRVPPAAARPEPASERANARRPANPERSPAQPPGPIPETRASTAPLGRAERSAPKPSTRRRPRPSPGNAPSARRPGGARSPPRGRRPRAPLSLPMAQDGAQGLGC